MPLMFKGQEEALKQIAACGRKPAAEEMEKLRRSFFETLHMVVENTITAITLSARTTGVEPPSRQRADTYRKYSQAPACPTNA
ncbi:hypothetical protein [Rhizobium laguerreae]|uniref:hypothetical protein n=2 Tax=Rhizobium TaxID=379 RepID=UPI001C8FEA32|nr:hypothetical protein [Rhizobium laguerreae]MBY3168863.1 hypothetical protein [Rhizobium laguerreae]MBY3265316.1 hypothetical protein [Rhizobium laguerreae]MBY3337757.1 hypothetical protein [Rhizobium laguerreae]